MPDVEPDAPQPPGAPRFYLICAWCKRILGDAPQHASNNSFGICRRCAHAYFPDLYRPEDLPPPPPPEELLLPRQRRRALT